MASGCNDLGSCDDPARGRTTVVIGSQVMYAGQAIMNVSCATGCHSSVTKGEGRRGAPAGLDFDLTPLRPGAVISGPSGVTGVEVDPVALAGLRARQRKVFDERENIWEQVDQGLMPPGKIGETFTDLMRVVGIKFEPTSKSCTRDTVGYGSFGEQKKVLRSWLACGTPVVETTSPDLPFVAPAGDAGPAEQAAGAYAYAGATGYQYPSCSGGSDGDAGVDGGDGDGGPAATTFDAVYAILEDINNSCLTCHSGRGAMGNFDLGASADTAYMKLVGADMTGGASTCAAKPKYIVPNDPANSYFLTMVDETLTGRCTGNVMPPFGEGGLTAPELATITAWINAGAPR